MKKAAKKQNNYQAIRPALTPEARENQMISLAEALAEKQLLEGTASSQVITHYLKLGTSKERLEKEKLEKETALLRAKVEAIKSQQRSEELYSRVISAMKKYGGEDNEELYDDQDIY